MHFTDQIQNSYNNDNDDDDDDDDDFEAAMPSDTLAAIYSIANQFPSIFYHNRIPPITLRHHIYAIVKDTTTVDRELIDLLLEGMYVC